MTKINCNFKGEKNGNAKLSDDQVSEIRTIYQNGEMTLRQLGEVFKISHSQVRRIVLEIQR